jgi:hypothetical protein
MPLFSALFVCEGTSDLPISELIEELLLDRGVEVQMTTPDYSLLPSRVSRDVASKLSAGVSLMRSDPDIVVVHRDQDNTNPGNRRTEISNAVNEVCPQAELIPVIPVRMTEAWLLLDEEAIRRVAGKPNGKHPLPLPHRNSVERVADPKTLLQEIILEASMTTGRRRSRLTQRFPQNRKQLLELLDLDGPVKSLSSWQTLLRDIDEVSGRLQFRSNQ